MSLTSWFQSLVGRPVPASTPTSPGTPATSTGAQALAAVESALCEALCGTQPVVPHSDIENRWKNRRVEFVLVRK